MEELNQTNLMKDWKLWLCGIVILCMIFFCNGNSNGLNTRVVKNYIIDHHHIEVVDIGNVEKVNDNCYRFEIDCKSSDGSVVRRSASVELFTNGAINRVYIY